MSEWLRNLLGLEDREIPTDAVTAFEFANMPRGAAALLLFLLVGFLIASVFWIYRREGSAKRGVKITLAVLRSLVIVAIALLLLEPVLTIDRIDRVEKKTLLLLDESYSMTTRDRYQDPMERAALRVALELPLDAATRTDLVNAALRKSDLVSRLARNNPVEVFRFADGLVPVLSVPRMPGGVRTATVPALDPTKNPGAAKGTNLTHAVRQAVEEIGSDRVAALIVISDGRSNLGAPPEDLPVFLRNKALKLYTVAVGDDEPARNLRAVALAGPERMFRRDPANFEAKVSARGFESATVIFERRYKDEDVWERIETRPVAFVRDGAVVDLTFADKPAKTGVLDYRIRIDPEAEEATERDNQKSFRTVVVDEKAKVLLIAGGPSHEYRAVKNVLLRDRTIQLACYLQSADPKFPQDGNDISLPDVPNDEKGLFTFDVVILCDPNGTRFPPGFTDLLKKFVSEHRGGLGFVAGNQHTLALLRPDRETYGIAALLETNAGSGRYTAERNSFPDGDFELNVVRGTDNVLGVILGGPGVHVITAPLANDTLTALQSLTVTWTSPSQAKSAELETRNYGPLVVPDTGAAMVPALENVARANQRIRVFRFNEVGIDGGLPGSRLRVEIRQTAEPIVVQ
ncbi:MAG: hypothetical protein ACE10D_04175 [Planctomycetota bacterium]